MHTISKSSADATKHAHIGALLAQRAESTPTKDFLRFADRSYSYAEANEAVDRLAQGFKNRGVQKGDAVCVMLPNCSEYVLTWMALAKLGAVTVSINTGYKEISLERAVNASKASLIVVDTQFAADVLNVISDLPLLEKLIVVRGTGPAFWHPSLDVELFEQLPDSPGDDLLAEVSPGDPLMMIFTSGTSGLPKPVQISHAYAYLAAEDSAFFTGLTEDDVLYCAYPMYHSEATLNIILPTLVLGATVGLGAKFSASGFWDEVNRFEATFFTFLGGVVNILLAQPPREDDANNKVRRVFGCPVPENAAEFEQRFGLQVFEWYAATEGGMLAFDPLDEGHVQGSCGVPSPHYEMRIVDEDGFDVPPGTPGEIVTRSLRPHGQMIGYYGNPEATLEVFADCWFHSRDIGYINDAGRLFYLGRTGDAIRRRGVNISALEVELALNSHPSVVESAVVGVPSALGDEHDVKAIVMSTDGIAAEALVEFARSRLPRALVPRYVEVVEDMPRTPTGKILKRTLRDDWRTSTTYDAETGELLSADASLSETLQP